MTRTGTGTRISVDVGGTFTDLVLADSGGTVLSKKVLSTPDGPERAVVAAVLEALAEFGARAADVVEVLHGTTIGSNTLLEKTGAATGLITTKGFRDILEIGRVRTPDMFNIRWRKPDPLVERRHRLEVRERISADGTVIRPLNEDDVVAAGRQLLADGIRSVAVCFINSYRNPVHERRAGDILTASFPELAVTISASILPEAKEYERTSTAAVNAYVLPVMRRYLQRLKQGLAEIGVTAPLLVVNSGGGLSGAELAGDKPVFFISSGPAAGVTGATRLGMAVGERNMIVFDMGGTTAKAALVAEGVISRTNEYEFRGGISTPSRFIKAGGYLMRVPAIDIAEVGAGAGSIAWVDPGRLIHVGPRSAGADPGPACYGRGGELPTVTDANVVLGYLSSEALAGGTLAIDAGKARHVVARGLADPLGISVEQAAMGIREIVNANMARAIKAVTVERGVDPRDFVLVAFGGSGPAHACDLAAMLNIRRVILPNLAGVFTAAGMLASDVERPFSESLSGLLDEDAGAGIFEALSGLERRAAEALAEESFRPDEIGFARFVDMRFQNQDTELSVDVTELGPSGFVGALRERFLADYERTYEYRASDRLELVAARVVGIGRRAGKLDFRAYASLDGAGSGPSRRQRKVHFAREKGAIDTPVIARTALPPVARGPLVVESADSTVVVPPGAEIACDPAGNIVVELEL